MTKFRQCLALLLYQLIAGFGTTFLEAQAQATATSGVITAVLQEAHGYVYKRSFKDWARGIWDDPQPAAAAAPIAVPAVSALTGVAAPATTTLDAGTALGSTVSTATGIVNGATGTVTNLLNNTLG